MPLELVTEAEITSVAWMRRNEMIVSNQIRAATLRENIAERKAEKLLLQCLTPKQHKEWKNKKSLRVKPRGTKREYEIEKGWEENVYLTKATKTHKDRRLREVGICFCAHLSYTYETPVIDNVLAQLLLLRSQEGEQLFLSVAHPRR